MPPTPVAGLVVTSRDVLFSLPLPLLAVILLFLGLLIGAGGWLLARRRLASRRQISRHATVSWISTVSQAVPCGVVLITAQGQVKVANREARCWMGEAECLADLPPNIQTVVNRAAASGLSEEVAVNGISGVGHLSWIEVAPLGDSGNVLIVIKERDSSGVDAQVYRPTKRSARGAILLPARLPPL